MAETIRNFAGNVIMLHNKSKWIREPSKPMDSRAEQLGWRDRFESLFDSFIESNPGGGFRYDVDKKRVEEFIGKEIAAERDRVMAVVEREVERMAIRKDYVSLKDVEDLINLIRAKL